MSVFLLFFYEYEDYECSNEKKIIKNNNKKKKKKKKKKKNKICLLNTFFHYLTRFFL